MLLPRPPLPINPTIRGLPCASALRVRATSRANHLARLREQLHDVLNFVHENVQRLAEEEAVAAHYKAADQDGSSPLLRFLSPLARGADQLAAEVAVGLGYELFVPMPFSRDEYEKDFKLTQNLADAVPVGAEDLQKFGDLLEKARGAWLSLDGSRDDQDRAYEAVGQFVARHSDLLIAIWDGKPWERRGGTGEIIDYAILHGVPVWWIHATQACAPVWLTNVEDRPDARPLLSEPAALVLRTYLEKHIRPPQPVLRDRHGLIGSLARQGQDRHVTPVADYYAEDARPPGCWSRAYSVLMRLASRCSLPWTELAAPHDPVARYWFDLYTPADRCAGEYAARYRSAYVWLFLFATLTLIFGATAAVAHGHHGFLQAVVFVMTFLEMATLCFIGVVVLAAIRGDWHERFIEYRLLAELCRKQLVLAPLGRAVSLDAVRRMVLREIEHAAPAVAAEKSSDAEIRARAAWVAWLFAAWERAAPLPRERIAPALREIVDKQVLEGLIDDQLKYHNGRAEMSERADEVFFRIGQRSFLAVCVCVALKLVAQAVSFFAHGLDEILVWEISYQGLTWLAIVLPALSAAALGIRSYAELQLLAEQSRHMVEELLHAKRRITQLNLERALAAEDVGAETHAAATLMLQDLEGWSRLFKVKAIEP